MHCICGLLLQLSQVARSVCLYVMLCLVTRMWPQTTAQDAGGDFGADSGETKEPYIILDGVEIIDGKGHFWGCSVH